MAKTDAKSLYSYLERDDLEEIKELSEADLYIFSILSYLKFEYFIDINKGEAAISDLSTLYPITIEGKYDNRKQALRFAELLGKCKRYKNLRIFNFKSIQDEEKELQFGALSIWLPNGDIFVSFRGTDDTLTGWKEDANLSFLTEIPGERVALDYLNDLMERYPDKNFLLGGHSKGGLLAIYSASKVDRYKQGRISYVMDCDCPGFNRILYDDPGYQNIVDKIHTFIPEKSLIGLIYRKRQPVTIIASSGVSLYQHSEWTWNIVGDSLEHIRTFESGEELSDGTMNKIMDKLTAKEREYFVEMIYEIIKEDNNKLGDLLAVAKIKKMVGKYKSLSEQDKNEMKNILKKLAVTIWNRNK